MSSFDRLRLSRLAAALMVLAVSAVLAGCNVRPLYGTAPDGSSTRTDLAGINVVPASGRVGQQVRNDLLFQLNGGTPGPTAYQVDLNVNTSSSGIIVRRVGGQPQARNVRVQADFRLRQAGGEDVLFSGRVTRFAAFDRSDQRFANDRAQLDAENRAAREVAEEIRLRLAAFVASGGAVASRSTPVVEPELDNLTEFERREDERSPFDRRPDDTAYGTE